VAEAVVHEGLCAELVIREDLCGRFTGSWETM
jgi:hypothetical protein